MREGLRAPTELLLPEILNRIEPSGVTDRVLGSQRTLLAVSYQAVWPRVLGLVPIRVVVVRDPEGRMDDVYLFTTDLGASLVWVIEQFSWRWSIEVLFRASKQVMQI